MALHLVTGGAGFIGSSIAEALLKSGESVRILDDFSSGRRENLETLRGRWELVEGSIVDPETVARATRGVEIVFHEAAIPSVVRSVEDPQATMRVGVQGTTVVLDLARQAGVRRVIFAASSAAYGDGEELPKVETLPVNPMSPYAASKLAGEQCMRVFSLLYGIETVSLRYFNVFGARQDPKSEYAAVVPRFITAALRNERPIVFGDGEQTRDFCHVDNAVHANLLAASTKRRLSGEVVNIACGERTSLNQLLKAIGELVGRPLSPEYRAARAGDIRDSHADVSAARALLDYRPTVDLRDGLARTFAAFERLAG
ncbi:MAG TPA: SDR family oxidoreductase [Polyangiaceae bacterium]|jgi:nucleoside-diphosphate-sugar epimerase|nr:SDR family oxidoreductase [Polyangiaceae bacterium]